MTGTTTAIHSGLPDHMNAPPGSSVARLHRIGSVNGAKRYLEIGVQKGNTFLNLDFAEMDAVDPNFRFDTAAHAAPGRRFFGITSDQFFANPPDHKVYDIIFLDGLHTFEQTFRDFCATQALAHAGTVWLIDDTLPTDIFSVIPDQAKALEIRGMHGLKSRAWHGDVFKLALAIHDFFPNFDYRTVTDEGNGQTVVIRKPRPAFAPRWNSMETISRMDFRAFLENSDLLNESTNEAMFDWLAAADLTARRAG